MKILAIGTRYATDPDWYGRLELRVGASYDPDRGVVLLHVVGTEGDKFAVYDTHCDEVRVERGLQSAEARDAARRVLDQLSDQDYARTVLDRPDVTLRISPPREPESFEEVEEETLGSEASADEAKR